MIIKTLYCTLKKSVLISWCLLALFVMVPTAQAADSNPLTWGSFLPADGETIMGSTVDIEANVTDWDSLAEGTFRLFLNGAEVPATVTYTSGWAGGG